MQNIEQLTAFLLFTLLTISNAQNELILGEFCHKTSSAGKGYTRLTFLRETALGLNILYSSVWSEDMQLMACTIYNNPVVTRSYLSSCHKHDRQGQAVDRFNISMLLTSDSPCLLDYYDGYKIGKRTKRDVSHLSLQRSEVKLRTKRSWIFPGTLWCGTGSKAIGYEQLGMFEDADRCCREHDQCVNVIPSFTVNYGVFNPNFFTVSQCDCDQRFRECLHGVNDTISNMVGYSFFNILKVPCFELIPRRQCIQMYWWGMCKKAQVAPYASFQSSLGYNTANITSKDNQIQDSPWSATTKGLHVMKTPMVSSNKMASKRQKPKPSAPSRGCAPRATLSGDTFERRGRRGKGCGRRRRPSTATTTQIFKVYTRHTSVPPTTPPIHETTALNRAWRMTLSATVSTVTAPRSNTSKWGTKYNPKMELAEFPGEKSQVPLWTMTQPQWKLTSTARSISPVMQISPNDEHTKQNLLEANSSALHTHTNITITSPATTLLNNKKVKKKRHHCGTEMPAKGDTLARHTSCLGQESSLKLTATHSTDTVVLQTQAETSRVQKHNKTKVALREKPRGNLESPHPTWEPTKSRLGHQKKTTALPIKNSKLRKQRNNLAPTEKITQEYIMADNQSHCRILKLLDECKHKIPPLEKKYDLQNLESKTSYHCRCTTRLAEQIKYLRMPSPIPSLLKDFVSQYCFLRRDERDCRHRRRKSCAAGFSKASDLLRALEIMEGNDSAAIQNSDKEKQRGFPVRLYKRCLRIVEPDRRS